MDLSVFAKEKFDAKDWINSTFRQSEAQTNPENYASSLVMKLQLASYEISSTFENTSGMVVQSLPRLLRDVELLQQEVAHFHEKLESIKTQVIKVEKDTVSSLEQLIKLDTMKTKLVETTKALKEPDNWTTLMADIEELFDSADLMALSVRLCSLKQSLDLLSHVNDYSDRLLQLEGLRNRLEALASPDLVAAISIGDAVKAAALVQVFANMDRLEQLVHYYTKCRRGIVLQVWKELMDTFENEDANLVDIIDSFHNSLLCDLQEQTRWYCQVFERHESMNSASSVLLPIYTQALYALDPRPIACLESHIKKSTASGNLFLLQQLKASSDRLAYGVEAHLKDSAGPADDEEAVLQLCESLYQSFRLLLSNKYQYFCYQYLTDQFAESKAKTDGREETIDRIRELKQCQSKIGSVMEATFSSCVNLTRGCGLHLWQQAWNEFLVDHLKQYACVLEALRRPQQAAEDGLHTALLLLQTLGDLMILLEDNNTVLSTQSRNHLCKLDQEMSPFNRPLVLYLERQSSHKLKLVIADIDKDASYCLVKDAIKSVLKLNCDVQSCIHEILMKPIREQMAAVGSGDWASAISRVGFTGADDLPQFGLAPMEYITQVGQYLMMLPQHLEPFILHENKGLDRLLSQLVFPDCQTDQVYSASQSAADFILACVAKASAKAFAAVALRIPTLTVKAAKQLAADIDYLENIFEDLAIVLPANLSQVRDLLRAAAASISASDVHRFKSVSRDKDQRLVAAVAAMCNLPLD